MRNAVVERELEHLRVDQHEPEVRGRIAVKHRENHGIDANRLARPRRTSHEQMRHLGEVDHEGLAADVLAERERERRRAFSEGLALEDLLEADRLPHGVRNFKTNEARVRNARHDAHGLNAERAAQVVPHVVDLRTLDTGTGLEPVLGDHGTGLDASDRGLDAVALELGDDEPARHLQVVGAVGLAMSGRLVEKRHAEGAVRMLGSPRGGLHCRTCGGRNGCRERIRPSERLDKCGGRSVIIDHAHDRHDARIRVYGLGLILGCEHLLAALGLEETGHGIDEPAADEAADALRDVSPLEVHQKRKADCNERDEKHRGESDADVVADAPGEAVAEDAARLARKDHLEAAKTQGLEAGRAHEHRQKADGGRDLGRIDAKRIRLALHAAPGRADREEADHRAAEHKPPGGKAEGREHEIGRPGAERAAEVLGRATRRNREGRIVERIAPERKRDHDGKEDRQQPAPCPEGPDRVHEPCAQQSLEVAARNGRRLNDRLGRLIPDVFLRLLLASAFFRFSCHFCA